MTTKTVGPDPIKWLKSKKGRKVMREALKTITESEEELNRARYPWRYGDRSALNI